MCNQIPVEFLTERKKSIYDKLSEEGGGTWATYMMMDIEEAYAPRRDEAATNTEQGCCRRCSDISECVEGCKLNEPGPHSHC